MPSIRKRAIILYLFCRSLGIPVMVYGHSANTGVDLYSYAEFEAIDQDDCYRMLRIWLSTWTGRNLATGLISWSSPCWGRTTAFDRLEVDCLKRLCEGYQTANEAACEHLIEKLRCYPAQEKLKPDYFGQLQKRIETIWMEELESICQNLESKDEAACNLCMEKIMHHKAPENMKSPFLQKVHERTYARATKRRAIPWRS